MVGAEVEALIAPCGRLGDLFGNRRLCIGVEVESGRLTNSVSSVAKLLQRFVEGLAKLPLEPVGHLLELVVALGELAYGVGQFLRAEHNQSDEQEKDQLTALDVEHGPKSRRSSPHATLPEFVPCHDRGVDQGPSSLLTEPIVFAHRGASADAPENTLEAFSLALEFGASGLESDVWLSADGVPVLDHDGMVRRSFGRGTPISAVRRADLPAHIPSLADLLERCGTGYHLSLDLKEPQVGQAVIDVVNETAPAMVERLWLCSPVWESLLPLRGHGAKLVDSTRMGRIKEGPELRAATLSREGIDAVNLHYSEWNAGLVSLFHRFDRVAFGWDVQEPELIRRFLRMGIDGIFSDHAQRMVDVYWTQFGTPPTQIT